MTRLEFENEIRRLFSTFGEKAFTPERLQIIWKEVKDFEFTWMQRNITEILAGNERAPLPKDFAVLATKERQRIYEIEKAKNTREAEKVWNWLSSEEIGFICQGIRDRIQGKVADEKWNSFVNVLKEMPKIGSD